MIQRFKLLALGILSTLLSFKWLRADFEMKGKGYSLKEFLNWKRLAFAGVCVIIAIHCANCQIVQVDSMKELKDSVFDISGWYRRMMPDDSSQVDSMGRMRFRDIRDTMEIIAILPDWETGQVETVKGRMVKLRDSFGWQFYIARQKCGEVPVKVGKKILYEYKCETFYQPIDSEKFADYYIKPPTYPEK